MVKTDYAQLPAELQEALATQAGIILTEFNPNAPGEATAVQKAILFATSGGVNVSCVFTLKDQGADIDNCPKETKEMLDIESWACTMTGTAITVSDASAVSALGAADKSGSDLVEVTPRGTINPGDFKDLWYVCPYGTKGGFVAIKLGNAFSTGGLSIQSADRGKGKFPFTYKGYTSLEAPTVVPFKFYIKKSASLPAREVSPEVA